MALGARGLIGAFRKLKALRKFRNVKRRLRLTKKRKFDTIGIKELAAKLKFNKNGTITRTKLSARKSAQFKEINKLNVRGRSRQVGAVLGGIAALGAGGFFGGHKLGRAITRRNKRKLSRR